MNTPVESMFLAENLSDEAINQINNLNNPALFFASNNLYVNPTKVQNGDDLASKLAGIIGKTANEIKPAFVVKQKRHLEIIRKMNIATHDLVENVLEKNRETTKQAITDARSKVSDTKEKKAAEEAALLEYAIYPFIKIEPNLVRYYPE